MALESDHSADWDAVRVMIDCLRDSMDPESLEEHCLTERSEVKDLYEQLCVCTKLHRKLAYELALANQEVETLQKLHHSQEVESQLSKMETRFGELQKEARRMDLLLPALARITTFMQARAEPNAAAAANDAVDAASLPELSQLWLEVQALASASFHERCDTPTQTVPLTAVTEDGTTQTTALLTTDQSTSACLSQARDSPRKDPEDTPCCAGDKHKEFGTQTELCSRRDKAVATELQDYELQRLQDMQEMQDELKSTVIREQEAIVALQIQLQELSGEIDTSNAALEVMKEERDVLGDEVAFLQAKLLRLERDRLSRERELVAEAEEHNIRMSIEISDLIAMIHQGAPWLMASMHDWRYSDLLEDREHEYGMESLQNLCKRLVHELQDQLVDLDRRDFDVLLSKSKDMIMWLSQQGTAAGFVEIDMREINGLQTDLSEAAATVNSTMEKLQDEWVRVRERETAYVLKRRQRVLQVLCGRLDGSSAPRHKVKKLKSAIGRFLADSGSIPTDVASRRGRPSEESHQALRPTPTKTYAAHVPQISLKELVKKR